MSKIKDKTDNWKEQSTASCNNRCLDAMSLINTFCVLVTRYKKGPIDHDELYEKVISLYKECDNYGFVNDK